MKNTAMNVDDDVAVPPEMLLSVERYAVYRCFTDGGVLLYIGETGELGKRLASHAQKAWFTQVRGIALEWYADELDALNAERRAIYVEHPKLNKQHRNVPTLAPRQPRPPRTRSPRTRQAPGPGLREQVVCEFAAAHPRPDAESLDRRRARAEKFLAEFRRRTGERANNTELGKAMKVSKATAGEIRRAIPGKEGTA